MREPEGLQFPSPMGAMKRAPQGLSPLEPVGTAATVLMQEMGLFVPSKRYGSRADSKHVPLISNWLYFNLPAGSALETTLFRSLLQCSLPYSPSHRGTNQCPTFSLGWPASTQREQMLF